MIEAVIIVGLIVLGRLLRRIQRAPIRLEIHHYIHFPGDDGGEEQLGPAPAGDNVVPFRPNPGARDIPPAG